MSLSGRWVPLHIEPKRNSDSTWYRSRRTFLRACRISRICETVVAMMVFLSVRVQGLAV